MQKVISSNIEEVELIIKDGLTAPEGKVFGNMLVKFKSGKIYKYKNVPDELYQEFLKSESKGKFLGAKIKPFHKCEEAKEITVIDKLKIDSFNLTDDGLQAKGEIIESHATFTGIEEVKK